MKYALITGGSRGIGRAISIQLARDGYAVVINFRNDTESARQTLNTILEEGGTAELLQFDVSKPESVSNALESWTAAHPSEHFDVLVNNAGIVRDVLFLEMEPDQWKDVIDTDLNSFYYVTRHVLKDMLAAHHGRIVNMSSISGQKGFCGNTNYTAAKSAIIGVTRSLATEVASKGITVNAVAPGLIDTAMAAGTDMSKIRQTLPMRRLGKPEEVAYLVSFLVSDKASFISGQTIGINGAAL